MSNIQQAAFSKDGYTALTLGVNPTQPRGVSPGMGVALARTAGGVTYAEQISIPDYIIELKWEEKNNDSDGNPLSASDYDKDFNYSTRTQTTGQSLINWFVNVGVGGLNTFTYTDYHGVAWTVRFLDSRLNFKRGKTGGWIGSLYLLCEIA